MQVEVKGNDIDSALRFLKRAIDKDGIHRQLKRRSESPNRTDRRKMKDLIASRRKRKTEQRKERTR
jgi:small subunit ribosomal protein S21